VFGRVLDAAIRLLPHLEKPVGGITRVGIVGETFPFKRERPVRERIEIIDPCVWIGLDERLGEKPVAAPVVSRTSSPASSDGSTASKKLVGVPGGKIVAVGEKFKLGDGRIW